MSTSFPPAIHMFSTRRFFRVCSIGVLVGMAHAAAAQSPPPAPAATLFRIFLADGSTLVSYGEYARVADQVVFSTPLGADDASPRLQLLSIPASAVDWEKTDAYAESARAARYAETGGPQDFAMLNAAVTQALNDIELTPDPARQVAMATEARQNVMKWVADHYGYRAPDVAQMATTFDDAIARAQTAAGVQHFDLALVANMAEPPSVPLMPAPTLQQSIEQALKATTLVRDSAEREAALRALRDSLADRADTWAAGALADVKRRLASEERTDRAYNNLTTYVVAAADRDVQAGRVLSVERLVTSTLRADDRLGRSRPGELTALLTLLDLRLEAARRVRLERDHWAARLQALRQYRAAVSKPLAAIDDSRPSLEAIRRLAGPSRAHLIEASAALAAADSEAAGIEVPPEAAAVQSLLTNVVQLAARSVAARTAAIESGDMQTAWQASSAAAGALLLLDRVHSDLRALTSASAAPIH
ncbi:MAG: hypothetical protein ACRD1V_06365 [Vicinamibacterales bacterium]